MTTTALDIITGAAKQLGVIFKNEQLSSDEANDGLIALNDMIDSWSNDNLLITAHTLESFTLTGASSYTIGDGGTLNTTRPINLITAVVRNSGYDYPLKFLTQEEYQVLIGAKAVTSQIPEYLIYDNAYPLATITMYTIPTTGSTLRLLSNKPLNNFPLLTTEVDLAPGTKRALRNNLAIELAPEYGVEAPATVQLNARTSLGAIKRSVSINNAMPLLNSRATKYSIITGTPWG